MSLKSKVPDILLCDLDAFYASVEQRDHPEYRGLPVIVGGSPDGRGVVSTCSYEARKFGIHSAMPSAEALRLCPGALFLPVNMAHYQRVSEQIFALYGRFTPEMEIVSIDEAYLALPPGKGPAAAADIHGAVREELQLSLTIGVSKNKLLAKIASEMAKPNGLGILRPEDVPELLWPRPVNMLPGLGPVSVRKLKEIGIITVGQLASAPASLLQSLLGNSGLIMQRSACGIDDRLLEPLREAKSISEENTFAADLADEDILLALLMAQAESLGYRLRSVGLFARTISIKLRFADFRTITRDRTLAAPTNSDMVIYQNAAELFAIHKGHPPWRLAGVKVSGLGSGEQLSLLDSLDHEKKKEDLQLVRDRLRERYGESVVYRARGLMGEKHGKEQAE